MDGLSVLAMATVTVAAAIYVQYRLPYLTATRTQAGWARAILMVTGLAFGWVVFKRIGSHEDNWMQVLIFLAAWGLVHVPAAIILFLKQQQRNSPNPPD